MKRRVQLSVCPLCRCSNLSKAMDCRDYFVSGDCFELFRCGDCGFLFTQNFVDETDVGAYYATEQYVSHSDTRKGGINMLYHAARSIMLRSKRRLLQRSVQGEGRRLLDVGCGTGYFLDAMKRSGWSVQGVEKSEEAARIGRVRFELDVVGRLGLLTKGERFDVITLWHVLEHLQNLSADLSALKGRLADEGRLVVAVPNSESYDARHYKEYWAAYDVPRHLWHFSVASFTRLMEENGLEVERVCILPFDSFYISWMSERNKKSRFAFLKGMVFGKIGLLKSLFDRSQASSLVFLIKKR